MILTVLFFLVLGIFVIAGVSFMAAKDIGNMNSLFSSGASFYVAESGMEDAIYRIKNNMTVSSNTLTIDGNSASVTVNTSTGSSSILSFASTSGSYKRIQAALTTGSGVAFNYGIQTGTGGMYMDGGSKITGNVYSNGSIQALSGVSITGTAIAAGTSTLGGSTYVGGVYVGTNGIGNAWAHNVIGGSVAGNLYCTTGSYNNKSCDTSKGDAPSVPLPYTTQNMIDWETAAAAGGTITGDYTVGYAGGTLGPKKITGSLTVNGGGKLVLTGPLWVVGNVTVTGGGSVSLPSNYAKNSETIISNGLITINGGANTGSGTSGSYLFIVSTSTCSGGSNCSGNYAITVTGGAGTIAISAQNGGISLSGAASLNAATASYVYITGGSTVNYDSGLASPSFVSGPKGGFSVSSWGEI